MRFSIFIFAILFSFIASAQSEYLLDLTHIKDPNKNTKRNAKLVKTNNHYLPDTLTLPVVDDFSTNKFKSFSTALATDSLRISKYKSFGGIVIPDSSFSLVPTYLFTHFVDTTALLPDTTFIKTELPDSTILFSSDTIFIKSFDTVYVYPRYNIQDTLWLSVKDTIEVSVNLNSTDSTLWKLVPADEINTKIWQDNNVYITNHFAVRPPSIGAAVFEGLDSLGLPYDTIVESHGLADKLTSKRINLTSVGFTEDVFLTFFFQAQGLGANAPEAKDSLIIEFRNGTDNWERVWFSLGKERSDFEKVVLTLDKKYYTNSFQFRFKNYATLSGNLDLWLVDYIKLSKSTEINDVAMVKQQSSFLKDYISVPWEHYVSAPEALKNELDFEIKNSFTLTSKNVKFDAEILNAESDSVFGFTDNNVNVSSNSYFTTGLRHSAFTEFPTNSNDSNTFEIVSFISAGVDELNSNDTVRFKQTFHNYYAYDDGTAETGYGLKGFDEGQVAYKFLAIKSDTLRAVQMYFNQSLEDNKGIEFDLMVWDDFNAPPKVQQLDTTKYYGINNFVTYKLRKPIKIGGTFYVGWKKRSVDYLNIGSDRNDTLNNQLFFNTGVWSPSNIIGAPMVRPVFGSDFVLGNEELLMDSKIKIYPNPANDLVNIESPDLVVDKIELLDVLGNLIIQTDNTEAIDVSELSSGIYILNIYSENNRLVKKIIKH